MVLCKQGKSCVIFVISAAKKYFFKLHKSYNMSLSKEKNHILLTLVRMALLAPLCRMANTFECPCSASPPADPKLVSEDTNKMSKS